MLSVVVDDHDMGITHIIRGDDHLNNAFRQYHLFKACGWNVPEFAHIPLIHGADGAKLSKRHGAVGTDAFRQMGYLPQAMRNYLLRLGWGHGDAEIISDAQAIEWFSLSAVGKSPARFDQVKFDNLNAHYIKTGDPHALLQAVKPFMKQTLTSEAEAFLLKAIPGVQARSKTLLDLAWGLEIYLGLPPLDDAAKAQINDATHEWVTRCLEILSNTDDYTEAALMEKIKSLALEHGEKLGVVAAALRIALTGRTVSPSLFEVMSLLGKAETCKRLMFFLNA
ncbi:MAG: glutamate--tRNA ligase family protein, partial [Alphaproteobacteria bacterium]|nr:glutamate--tRNA ligase family protein [Alphaproteobacteria bacterium]